MSQSLSPSLRRTLGIGFVILLFICGAAMGSPARITLHVPAKANEAAPAPDPARVERIRRDVEHLAGTLGERNHQQPATLAAAEAWAIAELEAAGLTVTMQDIDGVGHNLLARRASNAPGPHYLVGAHLDTAPGTPGADDNASGVAAVLELARNPELGKKHPVEFILWGNEEPPFFQTEAMGSRVHAKSIDPASLLGVFSLETVGYYRSEKGSQKWPMGLGVVMPTTADFVLFVGNPRSWMLVQDSLRDFRGATALMSVGASVPGSITGVDWSDHAEYWPYDVPGVMVTDTAPFRNPNYHEGTDVIWAVDPTRIAQVVQGMERVLR